MNPGISDIFYLFSRWFRETSIRQMTFLYRNVLEFRSHHYEQVKMNRKRRIGHAWRCTWHCMARLRKYISLYAMTMIHRQESSRASCEIYITPWYTKLLNNNITLDKTLDRIFRFGQCIIKRSGADRRSRMCARKNL